MTQEETDIEMAIASSCNAYFAHRAYMQPTPAFLQLFSDAFQLGADYAMDSAPQPPAALPWGQDAALKQLIAAAESMVSTVDSHDSDALLELDADPHPPSTINADADNLHRALIAFKAAAKGRTDGGAA